MNHPNHDDNPQQNLQVRVERTFLARRERIFQAWTDPALMAKWFTPAPLKPEGIEANPVPGGRYRIGMRQPDGTVHVAVGRYIEVKPPERLVFTWAWQTEPPMADTRVTLEFFEEGERTRVVLSHEWLASTDSQEDHRRGWEGCLENLQVQLSNGEV